MAELIDKWDVVSKLISLENEYQFFKGSEFALDAEKLYRRICELEIKIGKTQGIEVVRCCDCQHCDVYQKEPDSGTMLICMIHSFELVDPADYCSKGERKDNESGA